MSVFGNYSKSGGKTVVDNQHPSVFKYPWVPNKSVSPIPGNTNVLVQPTQRGTFFTHHLRSSPKPNILLTQNERITILKAHAKGSTGGEKPTRLVYDPTRRKHVLQTPTGPSPFVNTGGGYGAGGTGKGGAGGGSGRGNNPN